MNKAGREGTWCCTVKLCTKTSPAGLTSFAYRGHIDELSPLPHSCFRWMPPGDTAVITLNCKMWSGSFTPFATFASGLLSMSLK